MISRALLRRQAVPCSMHGERCHQPPDRPRSYDRGRGVRFTKRDNAIAPACTPPRTESPPACRRSTIRPDRQQSRRINCSATRLGRSPWAPSDCWAVEIRRSFEPFLLSTVLRHRGHEEVTPHVSLELLQFTTLGMSVQPLANTLMNYPKFPLDLVTR